MPSPRKISKGVGGHVSQQFPQLDMPEGDLGSPPWVYRCKALVPTPPKSYCKTVSEAWLPEGWDSFKYL